MSDNQVKENKAVTDSTLGNLWFGKGAGDSLAHAISVNAAGEPLIAELPGTMISASAAAVNKPFRFSTLSQIFGVPRARRSADGTASANFSIWNVGQFHDFNLGSNEGESTTDADVGLLTMSCPKALGYNPGNEFNLEYHGANISQAMAQGSHDSQSSLAVFRFRRGSITFASGVDNSPPGTIKMVLFGRPTATSTGQVVLKEWEWGADSFVNGISNNQILPFDIDMPFMHLGVTASAGADASNFYQIADLRINLFS